MRNRFVVQGAICLLTVFLASSMVVSAFSPEAHPTLWPVSSPESEIEPVEDSMHEFMEYVFQPAYLRLKENLQKEPTNARGWKPLKSDALILAESCNLLFSRKPEKDAEDWAAHAVAARTNGASVYAAAGERNYSETKAAFSRMLNSCNACHRQFEDGKHILTP